MNQVKSLLGAEMGILMKRFFLVPLLFVTPVFALAQEAPDPLVQSLTADFQAGFTSQQHVTEDLQKLIAAYQSLKAENAKLKADAVKPASVPTPAVK